MMVPKDGGKQGEGKQEMWPCFIPYDPAVPSTIAALVDPTATNTSGFSV